jgi:hypothetical protein
MLAKKFQEMKTLLTFPKPLHLRLLLLLTATLALLPLSTKAEPSVSAAIIIHSEKPLGPALGTFSTTGAFSDSGILVTESRVVSAIPAPFGVISHFKLRFEGTRGTFTIRTQITETVTNDGSIFFNEGVWEIVDGTGDYATLHGTGVIEGTVDDEANLITRIYTGLVRLQ